MSKGVREIFDMFEGRLVGTQLMKLSVCQVLGKMPDEIIELVTKNCWFMGSMEDAYAFTFTGNDLKDMHLIFLSDDLLKEGKEQVEFTIAHEIGHVILGHHNSVFSKQTPEEIKNQEKEADLFAQQHGF